jgi:dienelactone hydrolase
MRDALRLSGYREPLGLWTRPRPAPEHHPDLRAQRFEFSSRGDRVHGRLWLPPDRAECPLVLLQHGAGGSTESPYLEAAGGRWARQGAAVASIDFPLHGARADQKLATMLVASLSPDAVGDARTLVTEFARQAVVDLERALDALATFPEIDTSRVVYAGFSLGALIGAAFCALDPRPRAAALALGGAGLAPDDVDPGRYIGRFAPRPLLLVNAEDDQRIPRTAAEALRAAAGDPVEQRWFPGAHDALPGQALKAMWEFLAPALDLH